ncbi:hypothetical protein [uncultured Ruegeria sp.]|uniref:hypothetical protein n=1 Tax=uncultured Ruegeria sp. TaxID=259304 RepID=UPI00262C3118|nr:hypothetical protein [uncultured Ruegeria sp.]
MRHDTPQFYPDPYGNGQANVARIRMDISTEAMGKAAPDAFSTGYVNPLWRAAQRRIFKRNRADYERAKAILEEIGQ